jgi:hypothetical protein
MTHHHPTDGVELCRLASVFGRVESCGESRCAFWEPGGAVVDGRCAFEQLDLSFRPEAAALLLRVRATLEAAGDEEQAARRLFDRLVRETYSD